LRILLDTHIFLWALFEPTKLSSSLAEMYQDRQNTFFLSLVSIWEIQIKLQLGKLTFDIDLQKVITEQLNAGYIEILPIKLEHIFNVQSLPFHHKDPFDRLLISQAIIEDLFLASSDSMISAYSVRSIH